MHSMLEDFLYVYSVLTYPAAVESSDEKNAHLVGLQLHNVNIKYNNWRWYIHVNIMNCTTIRTVLVS